jgi:hypothetical protein
MGRALDSPHLDCRLYHNPAWLPRLLGENISKVVAVGFLDDETPEAVTDVELREQTYNAAVEGAPSQSPLLGCPELRV